MNWLGCLARRADQATPNICMNDAMLEVPLGLAIILLVQKLWRHAKYYMATTAILIMDWCLWPCVYNYDGNVRLISTDSLPESSVISLALNYVNDSLALLFVVWWIAYWALERLCLGYWSHCCCDLTCSQVSLICTSGVSTTKWGETQYACQPEQTVVGTHTHLPLKVAWKWHVCEIGPALALDLDLHFNTWAHVRKVFLAVKPPEVNHVGRPLFR